MYTVTLNTYMLASCFVMLSKADHRRSPTYAMPARLE